VLLPLLQPAQVEPAPRFQIQDVLRFRGRGGGGEESEGGANELWCSHVTPVSFVQVVQMLAGLSAC